jgi:hypothetical protein
VDDEMEAAKRSTSTPRCEVGKENTLIAAGGPQWMYRIQNTPRDGMIPV